MAKVEYKNDIKDLVKEMESFRKEYQKKGQKILQTAFTQFFNENPDIKTITWTQYTPYFNDGDECIFSVHDFYGSSKELGIGDFNSPYDLEDDEDGELGAFEYGSKEHDRIQKFARLLNPLEDVFKELFDDHVYVVATKNGFESEEYSHD